MRLTISLTIIDEVGVKGKSIILLYIFYVANWCVAACAWSQADIIITLTMAV